MNHVPTAPLPPNSSGPNPAERYQGWRLDDRDPATIRAMLPFYGWAYHHYFRVRTDGWQHIPPQGPVLFVGSHNGGLAAPDMHMFMYDWFCRMGLERPIYGLMHPQVWRANPVLAAAAARWGAVRAHPKMATAALGQGASVLVFPGGARDVFRPHNQRDRICLGTNRAYIKLALRHGVAVVPLVSWGAHDTLIVLGDCYAQARQLHQWGLPWPLGIDPEVVPVYLGWPWGLAVGPLPNMPWPHPIHTRVCQPIHFDRSGPEVAQDRDYVETCHQQVQQEMQQQLDGLVGAG